MFRTVTSVTFNSEKPKEHLCTWTYGTSFKILFKHLGYNCLCVPVDVTQTITQHLVVLSFNDNRQL